MPRGPSLIGPLIVPPTKTGAGVPLSSHRGWKGWVCGCGGWYFGDLISSRHLSIFLSELGADLVPLGFLSLSVSGFRMADYSPTSCLCQYPSGCSWRNQGMELEENIEAVGTGPFVLESVSTGVWAASKRDAVAKQHSWAARRANFAGVLLAGQLLYVFLTNP